LGDEYQFEEGKQRGSCQVASDSVQCSINNPLRFLPALRGVSLTTIGDLQQHIRMTWFAGLAPAGQILARKLFANFGAIFVAKRRTKNIDRFPLRDGNKPAVLRELPPLQATLIGRLANQKWVSPAGRAIDLDRIGRYSPPRGTSELYSLRPFAPNGLVLILHA